jgi:hypothetical protein
MEARQQKISRDIENKKNELKEKKSHRASSVKESSVMKAWIKEDVEKLHTMN